MGVAGFLIFFQIISCIKSWPEYISYFNETVPKGSRYEYLIDSSLDWGQDLYRLKKFVDEENISRIKVDYFGGSMPTFFIPQAQKWDVKYGPTSGWLAVSATYFQSSMLDSPKDGIWSYQWLRDNFESRTIIGGSILVYYIDEKTLEGKDISSPYPVKSYSAPN
jgi:hypothetical protein